jgi:hypothetical protein
LITAEKDRKVKQLSDDALKSEYLTEEINHPRSSIVWIYG